MRNSLFTMQKQETSIHHLSGLTKLLCFLILTGAVMYTFDIRIILCVMVFSIIILKISKITFSQIKIMVIYVLVFLIVNAILTFFFAPSYGTELYGTTTEIFKIFGPYIVTKETLFYIMTKFTKYASVIPLGMIFLLTTEPSEFGASLAGVGVHYKASYSVALTLRYFPDMQREYREISQAQQARGVEMSNKAKVGARITRALSVILPLILSTIDRIEVITNAMDLRGFGKKNNRTWYSKRKLKTSDFVALGISLAILLATLYVSIFINKGRFYNPFI